MDLLWDEVSDVRTNAVKALGKLRKVDDEVIQALIHTSKDSDSDVREQAAAALGQLFRDKSEKELLGYLQDTRSGWRTTGAYALAAKTHLSKQTLQEIDRLKGSDPRPWVRLGAWQASDLLQAKKERNR